MLQRRELFLIGAGMVAAKATASSLACATETPAPTADTAAKPAMPTKTVVTKADPHAGHAGHTAGTAVSAPAENVAFAKTTAECVAVGENCLAHCIRLLSTGDTGMKDCATAVNAMLAVCRGTGTLAVAVNPHLAAAARLCHDVCKDCAEACLPHVDHHAECKACMEACERAIAQAKLFV